MRHDAQVLRPPASPRLAPWLGLAAGLLNVNFALEVLLAPRRSVATTVVSDLAVAGRPWFWAFQAGDVASAVLLLVLSLLGWASSHDRRWRVGIALLAAFAASTLLAVVFPAHCGASASCPRTAEVSWADGLHDAISTLGTTSGVFSAAVLGWAAFRLRPLRPLAALHAAAFVLAGGLGLLFIWAQTTGHDSWLGWPQRLQIITLSAWFVAVGVSVARTAHLRRARAPRPDRMPP